MTKNIKAIIVDDEPIAREILQQHFSHIPIIDIVASCKSAVEAFQVINRETIDLIFLDINMPDISGLSLAKTLNSKSKIIFTTAYREYAVEGFDLQAVDYLLKPISFERLQQAMSKFINESAKVNVSPVQPSKERTFTFVKSDRKLVKVNFADILYIESLSDYLKIHLKDNTIITRETISNFEADLPSDMFVRCHRSYIVSIDKVNSISSESISLKQTSIPISRSYKEVVQKRLKL